MENSVWDGLILVAMLVLGGVGYNGVSLFKDVLPHVPAALSMCFFFVLHRG